MSGANPYAAPTSRPLDQEVAGTHRAVQVFVGFSVGMGFAYAVLMAIYWAYSWILVGQGVAVNQLFKHTYGADGYLIATIAPGVLALMTGGYWAIRIGRDDALAPAVWAGCAYTVLAAMLCVMPYDSQSPGWSIGLSLITPIPAYLIGGLLARRANVAARKAAAIAIR